MWKLRRRLIGLCLVPVLLAFVDDSATLAGQPAAYWEGDYSQVREGTPGFRILLTYGPLPYLAGSAVWVLAFVGMILMLPPTLALAVCFQFTLGHAMGAFSWLNSLPNGRTLPIFINAIAALGLAFGIRYWWTGPPPEDTQLGANLPNWIRWSIIVALCFVPILFTWSPS